MIEPDPCYNNETETPRLPINATTIEALEAMSDAIDVMLNDGLEPIIHHHGDFYVHDRNWLQRTGPCEFIWLVYQSGTHVLRLSPRNGLAYSPTRDAAGHIKTMEGCFCEGPHRWFHVTVTDASTSVFQITAEDAKRRAREADTEAFRRAS